MKRVIFIFLFVIGFAGASIAQPPTEHSFERVERFKKMRMIEMLDMNEDQSVRFFARYNEFENTRRELTRQKNESLDKIERLIRNKADAKEYEKLFAEVESTSRKIGEEKLKFFNGVSDVLTIEQRAKLLLFERRFESELREAVREARKRSHGRAGDEDNK